MRFITRFLLGGGLILLLAGLQGCAPLSSEVKATTGSDKQAAVENSPGVGAAAAQGLPVRFQKPSYFIAGPESDDAEGDEVVMTVGTDLSSAGPMPLREIIKILVDLKDMSVSWASDVDQSAKVDVDLGVNDDFFKALDNLLRQVDYYHEVEGNTIIVKYNETRKYHIGMPFMSSTYATAVGGNVLEGTSASNQISSAENIFDIWANIETNLDRVLQIYSETKAAAPPAEGEDGQATTTSSSTQGFYLIDRPIGLITVTAPRPLQEKIAEYIANLRNELMIQISIEAQIIEVEHSDKSVVGINWAGLLQGINAELRIADGGKVYPMGGNPDIHSGDILNSIIIKSGAASGAVGLQTAGVFNLVLNAIATEYGDTKVLSNPKLVVMNGQPTMINVGDNITYIDQIIITTVDGVSSTNVTTGTVFDGLGIGVLPLVTEDNEVVLNITPIISTLKDSTIEYKDVGANTIGLPWVKVRELNTTARIKSGDTLVIGGLIKETEYVKEEGKIPLLGDLPLLGGFFKQTTTNKPKTELVIIIKPTIM